MNYTTGKPTFHSTTPPDLTTCTRREILQYFNNTFDVDETLFTGITDEAFYVVPDRLRLPLIFYYTHTATLYINKMLAAGLIKERVNRSIEALCETGVDEMSWDDIENYRMGGAFQWPTLPEVHAYREAVRDVVSTVIMSTPLKLPVTSESPIWAIFMGMEHERIHIETSSVLMRQLPMEFIRGPPAVWKNAPTSASVPAGSNELVRLGGQGTKVTLGKPDDFPSFGWDNEYGQLTMEVPEFEVGKFHVTNAEYREFVEAGGYQIEQLWTQEGWQWVQFREVYHPVFWVCNRKCKNGCGTKMGLSSITHCKPATPTLTDDGAKDDGAKDGGAKKLRYDPSYQGFEFKLRTIYEEIDLPSDWPVEVNYHEAKAFCRWKGDGYRLPTEAESGLLRDAPAPGTENTLLSELIYQADFQANINLKFGSASPVNMFPPSKAGVYDAQGNVWQWVEDHFNGLPGFKSNYLYDDFSSPCFDGRHTMIMGGSFISTGDEASRFARFAFRRHFIQHAGFRYVKSKNTTPVRLTAMPGDVPDAGAIPLCSEAAMFETTNPQLTQESSAATEAKVIEEYISPAHSFYPAFASVCSPVGAPKATSRALVVGSGAGKLPCLLSAKYGVVVAQDYCGVFTKAAEKLAREGTLTLSDGTRVCAPECTLLNRIQFVQLTWLPVEIGFFDVVAVNLSLERSLNARAWLARFIGDLLQPNGRLIVAASLKQQVDVKEVLSSRKLRLVSTCEISPAPCEGNIAYITVWRDQD